MGNIWKYKYDLENNNVINILARTEESLGRMYSESEKYV